MHCHVISITEKWLSVLYNLVLSSYFYINILLIFKYFISVWNYTVHSHNKTEGKILSNGISCYNQLN